MKVTIFLDSSMAATENSPLAVRCHRKHQMHPTAKGEFPVAPSSRKPGPSRSPEPFRELIANTYGYYWSSFHYNVSILINLCYICSVNSSK